MTNPSKTIEKAASMSAKTWIMLVALVFVGLLIFYVTAPVARLTGDKLTSFGSRAASAASAGASSAAQPADPFPGAI